MLETAAFDVIEMNKEAKLLLVSKEEKGYLNQGIHFFYLEDEEAMQFKYHYHTFHKCLIVINGDIDYTIEGRDYHLTENDILWIPQYEAHKLSVKSTPIYRRLIIYLSPKLVESISKELQQTLQLFGKKYPNYMHIHEKHHKELLELTHKLIGMKQHEKNLHDLGDTMSIQLELISIFLKWLKVYFYSVTHKPINTTIDCKQQENDINKVVEYIGLNLSDPALSIESISKDVHLSKYHLMRKFKDSIGITIHQYITNERLIKSRELMKEGLTLLDVSYAVGFSDYTSFARAFKKLYAYSPKYFLKLNPSFINE
jgi:AraC-like DNA-binding protein/mannose-6-phosphate isomerase-like protein (cupin superfamily)